MQESHSSPCNYTEDRESRSSPSYDRQGPHAFNCSSQTKQPDSSLSCHRTFTSSLRHGATPLAINIQGLTSGVLQPLDFCIPCVRSYHSHVNPRQKSSSKNTSIVEHLDISTTWNGLRHTEAQELFRIHQAFTTTLERMLAGEILRIYWQSLQQASNGAHHPLHTTGVVRGISFCRDQLVGDMADLLYSSQVDMAKAQSGLLRLYLAANDCLVQYRMDSSRDTSITLRVFCARKPSMSSPIVEAAWVPDTILFKDLNESPCEGEEFFIVPQYQSNAAFGATRFPTNVSYIISSPDHPLTWLTWNDQVAGFCGIVPVYSEMSMEERHLKSVAQSYRETPQIAIEELCIEVKAILTDDNGSVVRYERIVRARVIVNIVPWYAKDYPCRSCDVSTGSNLYQRAKTTPTDARLNMQAAALEDVGFEDYCNTDRSLPPNRVPCVIDKDNQEHSAGSLPVTKPAINAIALSKLAQKHADLATHYADLAQRHADAEKHVKLLGLPRDFGTAQMHSPDLQVYFTGHFDSPAFVDQSRSRHRLSSGSSLSSHASGYTVDQIIAPFSRAIHARDATQDGFLESRLGPQPTTLPPLFQPGSSPQLTALPPPAFHLFPSQTFNEVSQTWNRLHTPQGNPLDHGQTSPRPVEPTDGHHSPSISEESRKRRARSSLSEISSQCPPKRIREAATHCSGEASTSLVSENDDGDTKFSAQDTAQSLENDLSKCTRKNEAQNPLDRLYRAPGVSFGLPTPDSLSNPSRAASQTMASISSGSRVPSSELEVIVEEDPQTRKVSRREQAILWSSYCQSANSDKENQPETESGQPRLSEDEKKAMEEAIERSLDDVVGKLEDVFLDRNTSSSSSSSSSSDDDGLGDFVNYGF